MAAKPTAMVHFKLSIRAERGDAGLWDFRGRIRPASSRKISRIVWRCGWNLDDYALAAPLPLGRPARPSFAGGGAVPETATVNGVFAATDVATCGRR